jgi:hypothetical protein
VFSIETKRKHKEAPGQLLCNCQQLRAFVFPNMARRNLARSWRPEERRRGDNPVDELNKMKEGETDAGLKTAALAGAAVRPGLRVVTAPNAGGVSSAGAGTATAPAIDEHAAPLFWAEEAKDFRAQWDAIQVSSVDEPRQAVQQTDSLVAAAMKRLAEMFAAERAKLASV